MEQRLNLGNEVRELKLGSTFNTPKPRTSFHTLKYDFKPASVDLSKTATLDVSSNNQVTVMMPHLDSSGVPKTVFKGNQRNYTKECVLIIDKVTGEITLEKLHHNIQVKKTRSETNNKSSNFSSHQQSAPQQSAHQQSTHQQPAHQVPVHQVPMHQLPAHQQASQQQSTHQQSAHQQSSINNASGSAGGSNAGTSASSSATDKPQFAPNNTQRVSNKTRVSTGIRKTAIGTFVPRHSPIQGSPSYPTHHRSPQQAPAWNANNGQSTLPSIPLIGMDDDFMPTTTPTKPVMNSVNSSSAASPASNLDVFNYHSNKPSKSSRKVNATSTNPITHSGHGANANANANANNSSHNSNILQNRSYDKMQQPRQSSSHHHNHHNHNNHHQLPKDDSNEVGVLSTSDSSDSSDSDSNSNSNSSDSDSNSNSDDDDADNQVMNVHHNAMHKPNPVDKIKPFDNGTGSLPALLLDEDLHLSSNSSDSDDD